MLLYLSILGRAVNFVRRKVDEVGQIRQRARVLEHGQRALDVVLDEGDGRVDRIVNVGLKRKAGQFRG